jgi:hypothetical protein
MLKEIRVPIFNVARLVLSTVVLCLALAALCAIEARAQGAVQTAGTAPESDKNWRGEVSFGGQGPRESNTVLLGFSRHLGTFGDGYTNHYLDVSVGFRNVDGVTTTAEANPDATVYQIFWSCQDTDSDVFRPDGGIGVVGLDVDADLFAKRFQVAFGVRIGAAFKFDRNPKHFGRGNRLNEIVFHMNGWGGARETKTGDLNLYNGYFPTVGLRGYF